MSGMNSRTGMIPGHHRRLGVSGYALNDDDQRTRTTLADGSVWNYGYDGKNQLVTATRGSQNAMTYAYDGIGNRTAATEDGAETTYTANLLNQYTAINAEAPTYDADGNMQTNAGWTYFWNNDSRLVKAEKESARLEFSYDYMGRRMFKKVYASNTLVKHEKYVYDGYKLVAIYDGLNSDALLKTFIWQPIGLDVPLCMTAGGVTYYYLTDGNKNVIGLYDNTGTQAAAYTYGPFGQLLSSTGTAVMENPFRFSSEFHDDETGLIYYNYRYYDPKLGRWTKRDPAYQWSKMNLYQMNLNNLLDKIDNLGKWWTNIHYAETSNWAGHLHYETVAAQLIGEYDDRVDSLWGWRGPLPGVGNQGYHFNRSSGGTDSRLEYSVQHLRNAKLYCTAYRYDKDHEEAAKELGTALHPLQDWVAHGDYEVTHPGMITSIHNAYSTQYDFGHSPGDYPDLYFLDVKNSSDGRATQGTIKQRTVYSPDGLVSSEYDVAEFEHGLKRYKLTEKKTKEVLNDFKRFVESDVGSVDCKCFFFGKIK